MSEVVSNLLAFSSDELQPAQQHTGNQVDLTFFKKRTKARMTNRSGIAFKRSIKIDQMPPLLLPRLPSYHAASLSFENGFIVVN